MRDTNEDPIRDAKAGAAQYRKLEKAGFSTRQLEIYQALYPRDSIFSMFMGYYVPTLNGSRRRWDFTRGSAAHRNTANRSFLMIA